jgi:hypothetical protein
MKLTCCACLLVCLFAVSQVLATKGQPGAPPAAAARSAPTAHPGYAHAQVHCASCHLVPDPGHITRSVWQEIILPKMSFYTGIHQLDPDQNPEADLYLASGLFPSEPSPASEAWPQIESYYLDHAPVGQHSPRTAT